MLSTITITMYKQKNISVVVRKLSVCTRIPAMVGPTKLPKENADNQTPKNNLKKITTFVTYRFKPRTPDLLSQDHLSFFRHSDTTYDIVTEISTLYTSL